jgi:CRISPR-associated protein Csm5
MKPFLHNYKLKLTAISPLHIGDGETYDPTNYVIDQGFMYYFDESALIGALDTNQRKILMQIVSKPNSYQQLQLFYRREDIRSIAKKIALYKIEVAPSIEKNYYDSLGKVKQREGGGNDVFNALTINATIKSKNIPFIPGSSFKGALKTAFFSYEAKDKRFEDVAIEIRNNKEIFKGFKFKNDYFGTFEQDPFSKIKISDFTPKKPNLQIKWTVNKKKKSDTTENDNTAVRFEFIAPGNEFIAEITLMELLDKKILEKINRNKDAKKQLKQPSRQYIQDDIVKIANSFYIPKFEAEQKWAQSKPAILVNDTYFQRAKPFLEKAKQNRGFFIRVGRHSGAVSMTLDDHRKIEIPQMKKDKDGNPILPKEKFVKEPFTYWLASSVDTVKSTEFIGWVYCEFIDDETYRELTQEADLFKSEQEKNRLKAEQKQKELEIEQRRAAQQRREEEEKRRKEEEEQKRKEAEKLAQMSPVEALIYELVTSHPNKNETKDIIIYNAIKSGKLDEYRCEALKILEQEMKALKKWVESSKKPEKDKKYKRTQEVIAMLEECQ